VSDEDYASFIGISATVMWTRLKERYGLPQTVEELKDLEKERKFKTLEMDTLVPTPGMHELLSQLREENFSLAVASSGVKKNINLILTRLGMLDYFDFIVSGEEVSRGKPAPDIFLKAAEKFSKKPEECIVIEDSTNGILGAKAAGMYCIAYFNPTSGNQDLSQADHILSGFTGAEPMKLISDFAGQYA
jgi:HAD superfamily hydrolase (TIGR01509 family)